MNVTLVNSNRSNKPYSKDRVFVLFLKVYVSGDLNNELHLETTLRPNKKALHFCKALYLLVVPLGLEPRTT